MPSLGVTFGSTTQVYYLVLAWVLACLALLYFFTRTPLGRLALGLRENSHRLAFLGYDVHKLGVMVFAISAMFSGIAGGLQVVNNEAANYVVFDAAVSAAVVLNTYIGGTKVFLGPALGAALMTFFGYAVSDLTRSWLLYQGVLFVLVMMFMPDGLAGLATKAAALRRRHGAAALLPILLLSLAAAAACSAGVAGVVESLHRTFSPDGRAPVAPLAWVGAIAPLAAGAALVWTVRRLLARLENRVESPAPTVPPVDGEPA